MTYTVESYPNDPIVISILHEGFNFDTDAAASTEAVLQLLNTVTEPVYFIADTSQVQFSMYDTLKGSTMAAQGDNPLFHHPNIKQVLLVVGDSVLQAMTAEGMQADIYGNVNIKSFAKLEDALTFARGG